MKTYRVYAEYVATCYVDVEANSEDEAYDKADNMDGGDFKEASAYGWSVLNDGIHEVQS